MKVLAKFEGLAVPATVVTANLPKDTRMKITANETVDKAGTNEKGNAGVLVVPAKSANTLGTVETPYKSLIEIEADGILAAGDHVKSGALNGTTQTAKKWVQGTDNEDLRWGIVWKGAADEGTAKVLTYA